MQLCSLSKTPTVFCWMFSALLFPRGVIIQQCGVSLENKWLRDTVREFCFRIICWYCITVGVQDLHYTYSLTCEATETAKPTTHLLHLSEKVCYSTCMNATIKFNAELCSVVEIVTYLFSSHNYPADSIHSVSLLPTLPSTFWPFMLQQILASIIWIFSKFWMKTYLLTVTAYVHHIGYFIWCMWCLWVWLMIHILGLERILSISFFYYNNHQHHISQFLFSRIHSAAVHQDSKQITHTARAN